MSDLIDRRAAIKTINKIRDVCDTESLDDYRDLLTECFEVMPSTQPSFPQRHENDHIAEVGKMDCISRQAVKDALVERTILEWEQLKMCYPMLEVVDEVPPVQPEQRWIPVTERFPEEDHWLGGSGRQFSDEVLVSVTNYDDEDIWTYISQTIDGEWALELPNHCKIIAWMPLPAPYREGEAK